jgi:hypothetical protein
VLIGFEAPQPEASVRSLGIIGRAARDNRDAVRRAPIAVRTLMMGRVSNEQLKLTARFLSESLG